MKRIYLALFLFLSLSASGRTQTPFAGDATNRSTLVMPVVIVTGNTFQAVLPSILGTSTPRKALTIQNNNASDNCWIQLMTPQITTAAKATSILLLPGGSYTRYWPYVPSDAIQATCATSSDTLYVDNQ